MNATSAVEPSTADVCIVGSGFCAFAAASVLLSEGRRVLVLAGGPRWGRRSSLYRGQVGTGRHAPLHRYRSRRFGGTSDVWGGRVASFERSDFEATDGVRHGWPIRRSDLADCYRRAARLLEVSGPEEYEWEALLCGLSEDTDDGPIRGDRLWLFSPPIKLAKRWDRMRQSPRLRILMDAHAVSLSVDRGEAGERTSVTGVMFTGFGKKRWFSMSFPVVILAAGGLESTRQLLLMERQSPGTLEGSDWLGRGYMSHLSGSAGSAELSHCIPRRYLRTASGTYARPAWRISSELAAEGRLNFRANVDLPPSSDPEHGSAVLSAYEIVKMLRGTRIPPELTVGHPPGTELLWNHLRNVMLGLPDLASLAWWWVRRRLLPYRRVPSLPPPSDTTVVGIHFDAEQSMSEKSVLTLSDDVDLFGMPRLKVDYHVAESDFSDVARSLDDLDDHLRRRGLGRLLSSRQDRAAAVRRSGVGSHHMGTTRAAETAGDGVVDPYGRVFGTECVYVCSSSVFPSSGVANPTFQAVAWSFWVASNLVSSPRQAGDRSIR